MSKGSNFWGTARGRLGNMVISSVRGQQIERKYQPKVANPKTFAQMRQRGAFAAAVKFFKHSQQNLFRFAFEDKTQKESDYNAFMRHNVSYFTAYNKVACDNPSLPALGFTAPVLLSYGSLASAEGVGFYNRQPVETTLFGLDCGTIEHGTTPANFLWGDVSTALCEKYDLQDGDIITIVVIETKLIASDVTKYYLDGTDAEMPATPAKWTIWQKRINTGSDETVTDNVANDRVFGIHNGINSQTFTYNYFGAVIFSRNVAGKSLMVSSSSLVASIDSYFSMWPAKDSDRELQVLSSWGANPEAILKGSLS